MKNQYNVSPPNSHQNNSTSESNDNELSKVSERESRNQLLKMIRDLKEDSNKQINEINPRPRQESQHMEKKFCKEMQTMKNN
jgi:hypothetical protein